MALPVALPVVLQVVLQVVLPVVLPAALRIYRNGGCNVVMTTSHPADMADVATAAM